MAFFITIRCNHPQNKKQEVLQKTIGNFDCTTTDNTFEQLCEHFKKIVSKANEMDKRSKEVKIEVYAPYQHGSSGDGSIHIAEGVIILYFTQVKGIIRHDFAVQTQL